MSQPTIGQPHAQTRERASAPKRSLKESLSSPEAYPLATNTTTVEVVETHISWVFLVGDDVFKVKRPVNLGFLDFSTLQKRRDACEAEVRLNRRLAPDVYVGVVPIVQSEDGVAQIGGSGSAVDWAVHMKRLSDAHRADTLMASGDLTPTRIDHIAKALAEFHARCRMDEETTRFGAPSVVFGNLEENFTQTRASLEVYLSHAQAEELKQWQRSFLKEHEARITHRMAEGHVRDGHGDLRLEHIYLEGPRVIVLDCIEFNARFRYADVCADIAFLSMDMAAHGRVDLAERMLAAYARETNDFDLYALVDFYESYRAYVRGKIAAMVADGATDSVAKERAQAEARRCFLLALSADRKSLIRPAVVAVGGVIASGKSTIADRVGAEMSAPVIDADRTRKSLLGLDPLQKIDDQAWTGSYDPQFTERVYEEVLRRAEIVLSSGRPVVVDASFRSASMRDAVRALARQYGAPFRLVECKTPADVCRSRLIEREKHGSVSDGRLAIFDDFCARFEAIDELSEGEHLALDTTRPVDENVGVLRAKLDVWPRGLEG